MGLRRTVSKKNFGMHDMLDKVIANSRVAVTATVRAVGFVRWVGNGMLRVVIRVAVQPD
jgi:hypothetical protein